MVPIIDGQHDFSKAKSKARSSAIYSFFTGRSDDLLSFEEVKKLVKPTSESYVGCKTIPVKRVVGSEGRCKDFNSSFMPRGEFMRNRWARVSQAYHQEKILPPVQVLEIGGVYFVRDGNHRVSVARAHNVIYIDAEVTALKGSVALEPGMTIRDIERQAHFAEGPKEAA